ncbi:MAG: Hpt domain-containing protein, partial [Bacteroidota bacterium]|nr:Hpt domain-containing protein [Bacteroidota bacterium]
VKEYFERLETGLLLLEQDTENFQAIDEIFRIMHSMKGSGGMFGFDLLSDVTHDLESLYDIFRTKKMPINSEVISFTLNSIDGLHHLLIQEPTEEHHLMAQKMKAETQLLIGKLIPSVEKMNEKDGPDNRTIDLKVTTDNQTTYFISFKPDENIFENGTNPLYLIDELNALGECNIQTFFDLLPELSKINPTKCYTSWEMFVATAEELDTLHDVFIFVSEKARIEIEKVSAGNMIHNESILAGFLNSRLNKETWTATEQPTVEENIEDEISTNEEIQESPVEINQPEKGLKINSLPTATVDSIRVDSQKIDQYMNLVSELITAQSRLELVSSEIHHPDLEIVTETLDKIGRQLRENAFEMSLIPLQSIAVRFKRLIHDLSKTLEKKVELVTEGLETELDKNIIEKLVEPLLHIIRNSLDHGIESTEERIAKSKNAVGTITIKAS